MFSYVYAFSPPPKYIKGYRKDLITIAIIFLEK
jgi:hypothetical protein